MQIEIPCCEAGPLHHIGVKWIRTSWFSINNPISQLSLQLSPGGWLVGGGNLGRWPWLAVALLLALPALRWPLLLQDKRDFLLHPHPDLLAIQRVRDAGQVVRRRVARQSDDVYSGEALV